MFVRGLLAVLVMAQTVTGYWLYEHTGELENLHDRISYEATKVSESHYVYDEEIGRLRSHNHGENSTDGLKKSVFELEMAHLELVGSVMALQKDTKQISDDLRYTQVLRIDPLESRLSNIDCGEKNIFKARRGEDPNICRAKK